MAGATAHQFDEMPVFTGAVAVALDVTDQFAVGLASGIKTETGFNLLVLQVTINGLGATDDLHAILLGCVVFSQYAGVGVGVVATDDDQCLDVQFAQDFDTLLELSFLLQLGASAAYDVEATGVAVLINDLGGEFHIVVVYESARAEDEAVELRGRIDALHAVEEAAYDVVAARSLTTAENDTDVDGVVLLSLTCNEFDDGQSIGVGEEFLNLGLVANALCGSPFLGCYGALQGLGELGLIGSPCDLQCALCHFVGFIEL